MELELMPGVGVSSFRFGMSAEEARGAVRDGGAFLIGGRDADPGQVTLSHDESGMVVVLGFTKGELSGVELFRFRREDCGVRVLLDGLDVFRTPSEELLARFAERGYAVEEDDLGFDALPELGVAFANVSGYEFPVDEDGDPVCFDYVLAATEITPGR
ncbi:hypothetical protein [Streptomyces sp. NPDC005435]|uniref:hypothetical protein n=1 Tax=Streptomyces sp. NPDC005435 TaxID=3154464 RepID=UPI003453F992